MGGVVVVFVVVVLSVCGVVLGEPPSACPPYTCTESVGHISRLRPCDVKVLVTLGDSYSAAAVAKSFDDPDLGILEWRGLSFSGGTGDGYPTFGNQLKIYTPDLMGGSVKYHLVEDHVEPYLYPDKDMLNAAQSGAVVQDCPKKQVGYLKRRAAELGVRPQTDWVVANVFIGGNNLCDICKNDKSNTPETYRQQLNATVAALYEAFPRLYVNFVSMGNLSQIYDIGHTVARCDVVHDLVQECDCLWKGGNAKDREAMDVGTVAYNGVMRDVAASWQGLNLTTMTVVYQPFFEETNLPGEGFLSPIDCFHPSAKGHEQLAVALWNSMLLPGPQKPKRITDFDSPFHCVADKNFVFPTR